MFFFKPLASLIANWQQAKTKWALEKGKQSSEGCPNKRGYLEVAQPKEVTERVQLVWFRAGHLR